MAASVRSTMRLIETALTALRPPIVAGEDVPGDLSQIKAGRAWPA